MPTKTISLDEEAYERLRARKREGESFSDVVKRLAGERSLLELAGAIPAEAVDDLEADIEAIRRQADAKTDAVAEEVDDALGR